uniref:Uncharacterized protein n=1 Tax=Cacopsylla melanoneura TaxID=428564 RepID=A0A8D9B984_9HEMI
MKNTGEEFVKNLKKKGNNRSRNNRFIIERKKHEKKRKSGKIQTLSKYWKDIIIGEKSKIREREIKGFGNKGKSYKCRTKEAKYNNYDSIIKLSSPTFLC